MESSMFVAKTMISETIIISLKSLPRVGLLIGFDSWFGGDRQNCVARPKMAHFCLWRPWTELPYPMRNGGIQVFLLSCSVIRRTSALFSSVDMVNFSFCRWVFRFRLVRMTSEASIYQGLCISDHLSSPFPSIYGIPVGVPVS